MSVLALLKLSVSPAECPADRHRRTVRLPPLSGSLTVRPPSSVTAAPPPVNVTVPPAVTVGAACTVSSVLVARCALQATPSLTSQVMCGWYRAPPPVGSPLDGEKL